MGNLSRGTGPRPPAKRAGSLLRAAAVMASGTVVSRVSGLLRLVLQTAALGSGLLASTYNIANTAPNSIYLLLGGGAVNSMLVPTLVRARQRDHDGGVAHEQRLVTMVLSLLAVTTVLAMLFAPAIVRVYLADTPRNHAAFQLTVTFARFLLPQILWYGVFTVFGQVLNARGRFGALAWTPALNNLILIAVFGGYLYAAHGASSVGGLSPAQVRLLGIGSTLGVAVQALTLVPYLRHAGFRWRARFDWRRTGLRSTVRSAHWTLLYVLANQVAIAVAAHYATAVDLRLPGAGVGYTAYSYAQMIWLLPHAVVTVSLATALLPRLSGAAARKRFDDIGNDIRHGLRLTTLAVVPVAFCFLALGPQIAVVLLLHGRFTLVEAHAMGHMLQGYALGLIPFSAQYLLLRPFYAFDDARTPFVVTACVNGLDVVLVVLCYHLLPTTLAVIGMAVCYGLSYWFGAFLAAGRLRRGFGIRPYDGALRRQAAAITVASVAGAAGAAVAAHLCSSLVRSPFLGALLGLSAGGVCMAAVFVLLARLLGALTDVRGMLRPPPSAEPAADPDEHATQVILTGNNHLDLWMPPPLDLWRPPALDTPTPWDQISPGRRRLS